MPCGMMRLHIIHGFSDGERIVLRFTLLIDLAPGAAADAWQAQLRLVMRHLIGCAVGDGATLAKPLATPGPRPELEKVWKHMARTHNWALAAQNKKLKNEAEQKRQQLKEQRTVNGAPMVNGSGRGGSNVNGSMEGTAAEAVQGGCNGAPKGGVVKKQCMLNAHASAKKGTG